MPPFMTFPDMDTPCGVCRDLFGLHWITHDGERQGCLGAPEATAGEACDCRGFALVWTPRQTLDPSLFAPPDVFEYRGDPEPAPAAARVLRGDGAGAEGVLPSSVIGTAWEEQRT